MKVHPLWPRHTCSTICYALLFFSSGARPQTCVCMCESHSGLYELGRLKLGELQCCMRVGHISECNDIGSMICRLYLISSWPATPKLMSIVNCAWFLFYDRTVRIRTRVLEILINIFMFSLSALSTNTSPCHSLTSSQFKLVQAPPPTPTPTSICSAFFVECPVQVEIEYAFGQLCVCIEGSPVQVQTPAQWQLKWADALMLSPSSILPLTFSHILDCMSLVIG